MEVFRENPTECQGKLARLAAWAVTQQKKEDAKPRESAEKTEQEEKKPDERNLEPSASSSAASSAGVRSRKKRATEAAEGAESVHTSNTNQLEGKMEHMLEQVLAGMQQLQTRMTDLEQKQPTNTDDTMTKEPRPSEESFKMVVPWPAAGRD